MPADPAHQLGLPQLGDAQAAVPVSPAEEQPPVVGHHQHLSANVHAGREGSGQETLRPGFGGGKRSKPVRNEK